MVGAVRGGVGNGRWTDGGEEREGMERVKCRRLLPDCVPECGFGEMWFVRTQDVTRGVGVGSGGGGDGGGSVWAVSAGGKVPRQAPRPLLTE